MFVLAVSVGLLLHVLAWGMGLAWTVTPRRWQRFWPVFVAPCGFLLQSLVVWIGAYLNLPGTNRYAAYSEAIPAVLLAYALWRAGVGRAIREVGRLLGVYLASLASVVVLSLPYARAYHGLTTASLGSCDAADYAAGARVFMEFARSDRTGFLGLSEVNRVMSVDNFYDFWLRLNHFTPSALIALNGSIFHCAPVEITGLLCAVFLAATVPTVFWLARTVLRLRSWPSVGIAALYGLTPVTWYAVYHVAMGQLLAAQAIALITWAGVSLWRGRLTVASARSLTGILLVAYGLILGSYNFIVLVCLVPSLAYAGGRAIWSEQWNRGFRWLGAMLVPLVLAGLVFPQRVAGLAERFLLFRTYDFGWRIPLLTVEGWFGLVANPFLMPLPDLAHWSLCVGLLGLIVAALIRGAKRQPEAVFAALCLTVPALIGYFYLNARGAQMGTNASYDAYKLFSVFYPGILPVACFWVAFGQGRSKAVAWLPWVVALGLGAGIARADLRFQQRMLTPPLVVGRELTQLGALETMPGVSSVNLIVPDMWQRLWANAFLLRLPQYFETHTYEGRLNTVLRGRWDLDGGLIGVELPLGASLQVNPDYALADTQSDYFIRVRMDRGWNGVERLAYTPVEWAWSGGDATIRIENPHKMAFKVTLKLRLKSVSPRQVEFWANDHKMRVEAVGPDVRTIEIPEVIVMPGATFVRLHTNAPPDFASAGDTRPLGFALYGGTVSVQEGQMTRAEAEAEGARGARPWENGWGHRGPGGPGGPHGPGGPEGERGGNGARARGEQAGEEIPLDSSEPAPGSAAHPQP